MVMRGRQAAPGNGELLLQEERAMCWARGTCSSVEGAGDSRAQRTVGQLHWEWDLQPNMRDATSSHLVVYVETGICNLGQPADGSFLPGFLSP